MCSLHMTSFLQELKYGDGIQLARSRELDECFAQANDQMEITDSLIREMRQMGQPCDAYQKRYCGDFPGSPVAKPPLLPMQGAQVRSLVRELDPTCCN